MNALINNLQKELTRYLIHFLIWEIPLIICQADFPIETLLEDQPEEYRFIPKWNYKIIYRIDHRDHTVIIARIFSTKQDPGKLNL